MVRIEAFLSQSPLFAVSRAAQRLDSHLTRILHSGELSFFGALLLVAIFFEEPRAIKPSRLAETFSTSRGNVSHCISGLEAKGLVKRRIDPEDARGFHVTLRPQGKALAMRLIRTFDQLQKEFERDIGTSDLQAALAVIRKVERVCERMPDRKL
jgi:DNA-binding MarR family transcriptional regulator